MLYSADMLLDKNKDYVVAENAALVASSASAFVRGLLPSIEDGGADSGTQRRNAFKLNSVGAQFRSQVRGREAAFTHTRALKRSMPPVLTRVTEAAAEETSSHVATYMMVKPNFGCCTLLRAVLGHVHCCTLFRRKPHS